MDIRHGSDASSQCSLAHRQPPRDASGSVVEPSWLWKITMVLKGANSQALSTRDVPIRDLTGKWVIISGSNNGIGREASLFFAKCGANIILACRNPPVHEIHPTDVVAECKSVSEMAGHSDAIIEWWEVNMASLSSVNAFADRWLQQNLPLDILCNNAGIGGNPGDAQGKMLMTEDGFEVVHQVNFLSHCLLTMRFLPSLARAEEPRVVCTTSCMMYFGTFDVNKFNGAGCRGEDFYCNNKLFLQVWLTELQLRLIGSGRYNHITINGVHPGYVNTGMWHVEKEKGWAAWKKYLEEAVVKLLAKLFAISAEQGSYAIIHAALDPQCGSGGGNYFNRIWKAESMPHCYDSESRFIVWRKVMEELRLEENCASIGHGHGHGIDAPI
ncbi:WW domain-containing oxidoreductase [Corynespora cassiicola Philippines]|uniref:WW domain-containing oxidoreductase n=1 Tax=Corynespora cassiicola Philippines TaxID=1448308 RepID=A0A2T2NW30_CORCC|nr:WW domain-containing oxidoreductase [Corynespora cassiicola Philippines]